MFCPQTCREKISKEPVVRNNVSQNCQLPFRGAALQPLGPQSVCAARVAPSRVRNQELFNASIKVTYWYFKSWWECKTVCWGDWGQFILVLLNKSTRNLLTLHLITMLCTLTKCAYLTIPVFSMREWLTYIEIWLFQANHKRQFTGKIHGLCAFTVCISWLFWVSYARKSIDDSLKLQIGFVYPLCHFCHSL